MKFLILSFFLFLIQDKEHHGYATYYDGKKFDGKKTANGETFSSKNFTAASNIFDLGNNVIVTNIDNGFFVIVKINDRMPMSTEKRGVIVDLSYSAAKVLNFIKKGRIQVSVKKI